MAASTQQHFYSRTPKAYGNHCWACVGLKAPGLTFSRDGRNRDIRNNDADSRVLFLIGSYHSSALFRCASIMWHPLIRRGQEIRWWFLYQQLQSQLKSAFLTEIMSNRAAIERKLIDNLFDIWIIVSVLLQANVLNIFFLEWEKAIFFNFFFF